MVDLLHPARPGCLLAIFEGALHNDPFVVFTVIMDAAPPSNVTQHLNTTTTVQDAVVADHGLASLLAQKSHPSMSFVKTTSVQILLCIVVATSNTHK